MLDTVKEASDFYITVLKIIAEQNIPFLIGGGVAVCEYTDINRPMKDLDLFCKTGDYPKILNLLKGKKIKTRILDERWLAQAEKDEYHVDFIFASHNYLNVVDDTWFEYARDINIDGYDFKMIAPEELIWGKVYIQDRNHYEGSDVNHLILSQGKNLDWKRLLHRLENHWEILLGALLNFRFVYPSKRGLVPKWLMGELISRLEQQLKNPIPQDQVCRGPLLSRTQYDVDIKEGFRLIV